jgi:hypothetical protein
MSDNPLKQYFRRPSIYFKLPSEGKYYAPGVVNIPPNGELAVYPMTTADEILIRTPDGLFNGASVVEVIKNCIPDIKDPWQLNSIDMEAVIVAIRAASVDGEIEINSSCPSCEEESKYGVNLLQLLAAKVDINYEKTLDIKELKVKFRPLTYAESNKNNMKQFEVQRLLASWEDAMDDERKKNIVSDGIKKLNDLTLDIVTQTIEYIETPEARVTEVEYIREFLSECDAKTSNTIKEHSSALKQKNDTKPLKITCIKCQHPYNQSLTLNFTDFFA